MSGASEIRRVETSDDIETRAAEWLVARHVRDDWDAGKQAEFDAWLEASPLRRVAYLRLEGAWRRTNRLRALHQPERNEQSAKMPSGLLRGAIAFAVVAIVGAAATLYMLQPRTQTYATAVGEHRVVKLADGTHIELNTDTVLRVLVGGERRTAWLDHGEAFFQVKHDTARPFVVMAGNRRITDLGTQFVVRRDVHRFEVGVIEGRVRFDAGDGQAHSSTLLLPGDTISANSDSSAMPKKSTGELAKELGWRQGVLIFDATPLVDAANEFNRYNNSKIIIADSEAARMHVGGTFRTNDGEAFVRLVQQVLGLHVRRDNNETVISR